MPNEVFDKHLALLSGAELKLLLCIFRQTYGWVDRQGKRKKRDRIAHSQFMQKTGLSRRIVSQGLQSLIAKKLIAVSDYQGNILSAQERKGKRYMYYAPTPQTYAENDRKLCTKQQGNRQKSAYNKTKGTKEKRQTSFSHEKRSSDWYRIQEILERKRQSLEHG